MKTDYLKKYIISSYLLVWLLIIFVAGTASLVFHAPPVVMWIVRNLIAWSPTYLLLIGWKHFRPDETRIAFVKRCLSGKIKPLLLILSFALVFGISFSVVYLRTDGRGIRLEGDTLHYLQYCCDHFHYHLDEYFFGAV